MAIITMRQRPDTECPRWVQLRGLLTCLLSRVLHLVNCEHCFTTSHTDPQMQHICSRSSAKICRTEKFRDLPV